MGIECSTPQLYTIGYATKPLDVFTAQLKKYAINVVADIRSVPYSKVFHDYHQESISAHLNRHNIAYVYLGEELGPRSRDPKHYDSSGQVQFDRLMLSPLFDQGVQRLTRGLKKDFTIALMCAEKDPATCHRSLLVGHFLARSPLALASGDTTTPPLDIQHITHDGNIERQQQLEQRIFQQYDSGADLFLSEDERWQQAYKAVLKQTSYRKE